LTYVALGQTRQACARIAGHRKPRTLRGGQEIAPETGEQLGGEIVSASPPMSAFPILNVRCWEHGQAAWGR
jgi:hypothetical protein